MDQDPNESDKRPEVPVDDPASNMEEDLDDVEETTQRLLHLSLNLDTGDKTPTDPGTGEPLIRVPRIQELRSETFSSPPFQRRSSSKLDFPPEVSTPKNSPENRSPEVTTAKPCTLVRELFESLPESPEDDLKNRTASLNRSPLGVKTRYSRRQSPKNRGLGGSPSPTQSSVTDRDISLVSRELIIGILESYSPGLSGQSPNLGLLGIPSPGNSAQNPSLGQSPGQSTQSPNQGYGSHSQAQSAQSPNIGLGGSHSHVQCAQSPGLGGHSLDQSGQSHNPGLGGSQSQGQCPPSLCPLFGGSRTQSSQQSPCQGLGATHTPGQSAQSPNPGLGGSHSQGQSGQSHNPWLGGSQTQSAQQSPHQGLGASHSPSQSGQSPHLSAIDTAAQDFTRNIMSDAIPESLGVASNAPPPVIQRPKRALPQSPIKGVPLRSPIKRHRWQPSALHEDGRCVDQAVRIRRRLSYEPRFEDEPEVRRETRKRSYSSGVPQTDTQEGQKKGKRDPDDEEK